MMPSSVRGPVNADGRRLLSDGVDQHRQAEVDDLRMAVVGNHDVGRLQVAVNDPLLVRARQSLSDLGRQGQRAAAAVVRD
jgi:hypothetical protein